MWLHLRNDFTERTYKIHLRVPQSSRGYEAAGEGRYGRLHVGIEGERGVAIAAPGVDSGVVSQTR